MKKFHLPIAFLIIVLALTLSCVSTPSTVDRGAYNPSKEARSDWAVLNIDWTVWISSIDSQKLEWTDPPQSNKPQTVKIPAGSHSFGLNYNNGSSYTVFPQTVIALLEKDKEYKVVSIVSKGRVKFDVLEASSNKSVALDQDALRGNSPSALSVFIKYVLNPGSDEHKKTVKLENDAMTLILKPDMVYELTDKASGKTSMGRQGFAMDFSMKDGKVYLLETDISKMSRKEFLDGDYEDKAQIVLIPTACSEKSVTFKYEKPDTLKDKEITLSIQQMD
jgi:hypothetical protein